MITITHPSKHSQSAPGGTVELAWVAGKTMKAYLHEAKLSGLKTHSRMDVKNDQGYFERIRTSYVPKDGDLIRLQRVRSAQ